MYAYVLFCIADHRYDDEIASFPEIAKSIIPTNYDHVPNVFRNGDFVLYAWHPLKDEHGVRSRINPGVVSHPEKGSFFTSGYAAEGMVDSPERSDSFSRVAPDAGIFSLTHVFQDGIRLSDSPGGVASNVWISSDGRTAECWSTQPPAIPTILASNRKGFCVISNRPRLAYCASTLSRGYTFSDDYLPKYISSGFAMDGKTPYPGTVAAPPNKAISLQNGKGSIVPYPIAVSPAITQETPLEVKSRRLAEILKGACWPGAAIGRANLFLSGGKDSRTIACALKGTTDISAFTVGSISHGEGFAASRVAERLGAGFQVRTQAIIADPLKAAANSNASTDGLGINFAHQYNFRQRLEFLEGLPSYHGHGHLLRGGFGRTMAHQPERIAASLYGAFLSPFATDEANNFTREELDKWKAEREGAFRDRRDVLLYSNMDFRLGFFTAPASLDLTSRTFMVYPLLDERVSRFASSLAVFDRITERVLFGAMQILAKDLTELPLFGEIWRFDRDPGRKDFPDSDHNFQDGFEKRQPREENKLAELNVTDSAFIYDADRGQIPPSTKTMASFVLDSSKAQDLEKLVQSHVFEEIRSFAKNGRNTDEHSKRDANMRFNLGSFISRVFIASTLYDLRW